MDWTLRVNGSRISGGSLTSDDSFTSSNPFDFSAGDGGTSALSFPVSVNDVIALKLRRPSTYPSNEFVGVDLTITATPVPEPSSLTLLFIGAICLFSYKMHRKGKRR